MERWERIMGELITTASSSGAHRSRKDIVEPVSRQLFLEPTGVT